MDVQGSHQESILNTIKELYNQQKFSDIIVISSQKTYNCHKVILSSKGEWGVNLKNSNRIDCSKFNDKVVERILKWLYLGENIISSEDSLEILTQLVNVGKKLNLNEVSLASLNCLSLKKEIKQKIKQKDKRTKRIEACGFCEGCQKEECGICGFCQDMPKFGGYGKLKKKCKFRTCSNQIQSRNLRKINKLVPVPVKETKLNIVVPEVLNNNNLSQNKPQCSLIVSPQSISTLTSSSSLPCSDISNTKNSKVTPEIINKVEFTPLADHNYNVEAISVNEGYREAKETLMENEPHGADELETETVDNDMAAHREGSRTDTDTVDREAEAIKLNGLSVSEVKQLRDSAEKHAFQAEVNKMMKLINNSLYKNNDVFIRELISNACDALDKFRILSLTEKSILDATEELTIKIEADKENKVLHITDTGIGMTQADLINNLGTIAKSGTSEFLGKLQDAASAGEMSDLIGQFGVGFYSAFLVADKVVVTSKNNDGSQHIWESDAESFSVVEDPRGPTLKRGTQISLYLKEEAHEFLEQDTVREVIKKYSQFINFNIYLWGSSTQTVKEPIEDDEDEEEVDAEEEKKEDDEEGAVEEDNEEEKKPKTKKVEKTTWDWELCNFAKPIWTKKPDDIEQEEYDEFYKSITRDKNGPMTQSHFIAEDEVTFKSLLFIPNTQASEQFNSYGKATENIKLYVRRVFITDDFKDMMPNYLSFVKGVVDSDDLPLNVSRETLQQHKLLKVIKKKLVRKTLDMIKKIPDNKYMEFWKEYSTNVKLGVIEDTANRTRLAKLLRFTSSSGNLTSLAEYVERMKDKQEAIYYIAGGSKEEVSSSPFFENLLKKGYELLLLTEAMDEYAISSLPEFEGKKFQNVAKEGFNLDGDTEASRERREAVKEKFDSLTKWLGEDALNDNILRAEVSERLVDSPCALVTSK